MLPLLFVIRPAVGQCDQQDGFNFTLAKTDKMFLYNLRKDVHETTDVSAAEPEVFARMTSLLLAMRTSIMYSRVNETQCEGVVPNAQVGAEAFLATRTEL